MLRNHSKHLISQAKNQDGNSSGIGRDTAQGFTAPSWIADPLHSWHDLMVTHAFVWNACNSEDLYFHITFPRDSRLLIIYSFRSACEVWIALGKFSRPTDLGINFAGKIQAPEKRAHPFLSCCGSYKGRRKHQCFQSFQCFSTAAKL